jgi:dsDNA-specific endonuclease/ATPase MutS2
LKFTVFTLPQLLARAGFTMKLSTALLFLLPTSSTIISAFHLPSHHPILTQLFQSTKNEQADSSYQDAPLSSSNYAESSSSPSTYKRTLRAGEEGYSLLRRPVTFDSEEVPTFDTPKTLNDDDNTYYRDNSRLQRHDLLGESSITKDDTSKNNSGSLVKSMVVTTSMEQQQGIHKKRQREEDQQLDMTSRTLDTLDYRYIIQALAEECGTVVAREIVWGSLDGDNVGSNKKDRKRNRKDGTDDDSIRSIAKEEEDVANMPLTAITMDGVHRRYTALIEMQALMEGRVNGWITPTSSSNQQNSSANVVSSNKNKKKNKPQRLPLNRPPIEGMSFDLRPILDMLDRNQVLDGPDILDLANMLTVCQEVLDWGEALKVVNDENDEKRIQQQQQQQQQGNDATLQQISFVELLKLTNAIQITPELYNLLTSAFDETGKLSGITFPTIGLLRSKVKSLKQSILSSIDSLLASSSIQSKLATEGGGALTMEINGRLVIPLQSKYQNLGIVHDASRTGKTAYVEPTEVVGPTNELRQAEAELRVEEARVWRELTETIIKYREEIVENVNAVGQLDLSMARVKLGKKLEGVVPEVRDEGVVNVKEARHPILLLRGIEGVVGSDVEIGEGDNQGLILTGPNSGGKTVILKLLGLYAFMVRDGIPVPSKAYEPARVDFFSPILADIGDLQSVDGDLSTFSGHMLVCREVLDNAGKNALVLMDELGSGTDPAQGVAIARALLEALLDRGCRVAITTHYMELKQLATSDSRFAVAGMQFLGGVPTYKLIPGMIGESFALAVAERLKLPPSVISRANELLDSDTRRMGELIQNLEDQKNLVEQKARELAKREMEMLELKAEMKRQQERLEAKQLDARRVEARKFAAKLEEKEKLLEDILEKLKGSGASKKVVADSWSDIRIVKREALSEAERLPGLTLRFQQQPQDQVELIPISEMKGVPELKVDDKVLVCKKGAFYGSEGTIQQVGKKIQVAVGDVSVRLTLREIAFPISTSTSGSTRKTSIEATKSKLSKRGIDLEDEEEVTVDISNSGKPRDSGSTMQMKSNTVDCIGEKPS